jgi:hypothetical protein
VKTSLGKWLIGVGLALLAGLLLLRLMPLGPHERFLQIPRGASKAEVIAILGPPGDYRSQPGPLYMFLTLEGLDNVEVWYFDEGRAEIAFDERMWVRYWSETERSSWFDRLLDWLRQARLLLS